MHKPPTIHSAILEFLQDRRSLRRKPRTIDFYRGNLTRFALFLIDDDRDPAIDEALTRPNVRAFFAELDEHDVSQDTFAAYDRALRTFAKFCLAENWIAVDPMAGRPRLRQARHKVPDTLSIAEIQILLDTCDDTCVGRRDRAILMLLVDTGMRAGELCGLTVARLERCGPDGGRIAIPAAMAKGHEDRIVMFTPATFQAVDAWLHCRGFPGPGAPLFVSVTGRQTLTDHPLTPGGLNQMVHRRFDAAGISGKRRVVHLFRHTFAKMYVRHGGDLESLRRLLGHSSLDTVQIYLKFQTDELESLALQHAPVKQLDLEGNKKPRDVLSRGWVEPFHTRSNLVLDRVQASYELN